MRSLSYFLSLGSLLSVGQTNPISSFGGLQESSLSLPLDQKPVSRLQGKFLHITDLHPDPFYKLHTSTAEESACHRGEGLAGYYGAETSDCDSPFALINETFKWISENIKDEVDFVVWTGDSSRHDSDESIPRTAAEVTSTNNFVAAKFAETFGNGLDPTDHKHKMAVPVIPTFGNNDFLPHNIFFEGPNKWLKTYSNVWNKFIPEEQRHGFERGGWFYVEVIPNKLAVFSLNTMYFFSHNAAVDGCSTKSEPGFEHMNWLRIQLQLLRERGMKAILTGHVPPARTESKELWDESCWQKYTLYLQQFRDVVVAGLYGHMNIDHFMIQDTKDLDLATLQGRVSSANSVRSQMDNEFNINSATDYLEELREHWSDLPKVPSFLTELDDSDVDPEKKKKSKKGKKEKKEKKGKKSKDKDKGLKKIGGPWGERFQVTHVGPSVVPNYFPTLRIFEYNITGLDSGAIWANQPTREVVNAEEELVLEEIVRFSENAASTLERLHITEDESNALVSNRKKGGKKHRKEKPRNPDLIIPPPPTKGSPPGPAYSPQTLTLLGYTQYFANITRINNDTDHMLDAERWRKGKHSGKKPKDGVPHPAKFGYEVEYDTFSDKIYKLKDLTVTNYLRLAYRMGQYKPERGDSVDGERLDDVVVYDDDDEDDDFGDEGKKGKKGKGGKHKKKKKHRKQREKNKVWLTFLRRAFVSTQETEDLLSLNDGDQEVGLHDGEL